MNAISEYEEDFLEAQIAVVAARLFVTGLCWALALGWLMHLKTIPKLYEANIRLMLWLFLVEILVGVCAVRYAAPESHPLGKRVAFVVIESVTQGWQFAIYLAANLVLRGFLVFVGTGIAIAAMGNGMSVRLVPLVLGVVFFVLCRFGATAMASPSIIRGTHIGSYQEAIKRAARITLQIHFAFVQKIREQGSVPGDSTEIQILSSP